MAVVYVVSRYDLTRGFSVVGAFKSVAKVKKLFHADAQHQLEFLDEYDWAKGVVQLKNPDETEIRIKKVIVDAKPELDRAAKRIAAPAAGAGASETKTGGAA